MEAIILLGGPGAGKGTLAEELMRQAGYLHVSTGDMLRAAVQSGSEVGREAKPCMEAGELVSDSIILKIIKERIKQEGPEAQFMFDGFPRTMDQAKALDVLFAEIGGTISHVFNLMVLSETLLARLTGRRVCKSCGAVYHMANKPPKQEGVCDVDGGELYQRADDSEATILNRLEIYEKQTAPLIDYYQKKQLLRDINASGTMAETDAAVMNVLNT